MVISAGPTGNTRLQPQGDGALGGTEALEVTNPFDSGSSPGGEHVDDLGAARVSEGLQRPRPRIGISALYEAASGEMAQDHHPLRGGLIRCVLRVPVLALL